MQHCPWLAAVVSLALVALAPSPADAAVLRATDARGGGGESLCLDIAGAGTAPGTDVILHRCHGGRNQDFTFDRASGEIRSALGNLCLDVDRGGAWSGNRVQAWTCNGSGAQQFTYDPRTRRLAFRASPSLCVDAAGAEARTRLWTCNGSPAQRYTVSTPYGNRRFDELTFPVAHNAFANYEDSRWAAPNQSRGIGRALRDGVRGFMLDIHSFESGTARCVLSFGSDCYGRDVYLCHGNCGGVPGVQYALPRQTLSGTLRTIVDFLNSHPDELVTVFLEDYVSSDELRGVLDGVPGLRQLQFDPYAWNVRDNRWPLASDMIDANRRLLIISDHDKRGLGVAFGPDVTVENYWSIGDMGNDYRCVSRWDSVPLDRTERGFQRLFVMNHFRNIATVVTAAMDNGYGNLSERMRDHCLPAAKRKPNFIAVDFYETGDALGVAAEVDDAAAILFQHGGFQGRGQLLGPGRHELGNLPIGHDAVSSLVSSSGAAVTLFEHGGLQGRSRRFAASAADVGDFNDLASSAVVDVAGSNLAQHRLLPGDFDGNGRADRLLYDGTSGDLWLGRSVATRLDWVPAGNIAGFGNLLDGSHAIYPGDYDHDGDTDLLFYFAGDGTWWLGASEGGTRFSWRVASNTSGFGSLLGTSHRIYPGDYDGDGRADILFHFADNGDWWLGRSDGASLTWRRVGNTSGFGNLLDASRAVYTGDFDGDHRTDVLFHYSGNGDWWLGASDGNTLAWRRVGNTAGFGALLDPDHAILVGNFDGLRGDDVLFHHGGSGDWWLGASDGANLAWRRVGNTAGFGSILGPGHRIATGDYDGNGTTDVMFHYGGNGDWWLGLSDGSNLAWRRASTSAGPGNALDPGRLLLNGDHDGDGKLDVLTYSSADGEWRLGQSTGGAFSWSAAGNTASLGDLTR